MGQGVTGEEEANDASVAAMDAPMPPTATWLCAEAGIRTHRSGRTRCRRLPMFRACLNTQWTVAASCLFTVAGAVQVSHLLLVWPELLRAPSAVQQTYRYSVSGSRRQRVYCRIYRGQA